MGKAEARQGGRQEARREARAAAVEAAGEETAAVAAVRGACWVAAGATAAGRAAEVMRVGARVARVVVVARAGAEAVVATARAIAVGTVAMEGVLRATVALPEAVEAEATRNTHRSHRSGQTYSTPPDLDGAGTKSRRREEGAEAAQGAAVEDLVGFEVARAERTAGVESNTRDSRHSSRTHNAREASCALRTKPRRWEAVVAVVEAVGEADLEVEMVEPAGLRAGAPCNRRDIRRNLQMRSTSLGDCRGVHTTPRTVAGERAARASVAREVAREGATVGEVVATMAANMEEGWVVTKEAACGEGLVEVQAVVAREVVAREAAMVVLREGWRGRRWWARWRWWGG